MFGWSIRGGEKTLKVSRQSTNQFIIAAVLFFFSVGARSDVPTAPPIECINENDSLQLNQSSVVLRNVRWRIPRSGEYGCAHAIPHRGDTGHFWFFNSENIELTCKVLDGRSLTGSYWLFCGSLTDVEWWMDAINNGNPEISKRYYNPPSKMASFGDVLALPPGLNRVPAFNSDHCAATFVIPKNTSSTVAAFVQDPDGDAITANVKIVKSDGGLEVSPKWTNPVAGTGVELVLSFKLSNQVGEHTLEIDASDGKQLIPTPCTIKFIVHP